MFEQHNKKSWMAGFGLALACSAGWAQTYQCSADGRTWISRSPCPAPAASPANGATVLRQYGAVPERQNAPLRLPSGAQRPADTHTQYLPSECARISEGMRTGPSRGVPYDVIAELRAEYQRKCQDEDREARQRAYEDQQRERKERRAAKDADRALVAEGARQTAQCDEMLGSLAAKKRRLDTLTPGERDDLARFQARYEERCKR